MDWPSVVTAISTAIIAVVVLGLGLSMLPLVRHSVRAAKTLEKMIGQVSDQAKAVVDETQHVVAKLRSEIDGIVETSEDIRDRVTTAVDAAEDRLVDLEALLDVAHEELEDTVLDVAAALRTTRRGSAILKSMKNVFLGSGKKKRRRKR